MATTKQQAQLEELPKRWPLVQTPENRDATFAKDAQLVNCYAEKNLRTGEYQVIKRSGLSAPLFTNRSGGGKGGAFWPSETPFTYYIFGSNIYKNNNLLSALASTSGNQFKFQLMDQAGKLVFGDQANAYYTDGSAVTKITDVDFPGTFVPGWAYLDGTLYVMGIDSKIQGSQIEDPVNWDPLNVIQARGAPGRGVGLSKHLSYVIAHRTNSTEAFYNAGNPTGSPLSRLDGGFSSYGCLSGYSIQTTTDTTLWATANESASPQIARMDNLKISIISTPPVERLLDSTSFAGALESWLFEHAGHRFYGLTSVNAPYSLVYDIDQNLWYRWASAGTSNVFDIVDMFSYQTPAPATPVTSFLAQSRTDGNIYKIDTCFVYTTDNGTVFPVDIYTPNFDAGVDRKKYLPVIRFTGDQVKGSTLKVRYNDNDFDPTKWSNFREVNMGNQRPFLMQNGTFYRRAMNLRHESPTSFRITSADLQMMLGTL